MEPQGWNRKLDLGPECRSLDVWQYSSFALRPVVEEGGLWPWWPLVLAGRLNPTPLTLCLCLCFCLYLFVLHSLQESGFSVPPYPHCAPKLLVAWILTRFLSFLAKKACWIGRRWLFGENLGFAQLWQEVNQFVSLLVTPHGQYFSWGMATHLSVATLSAENHFSKNWWLVANCTKQEAGSRVPVCAHGPVSKDLL